MNFEKIFDSISEKAPKPKSEYVGEDGLLHCSVCHEPTQCRTEIKSLGINKIVRCICECQVKERDAHKEAERLQEIERRRISCFAGTNMKAWSFENDDRQNARLSDAMLRYAEKFPEYRKNGKGLLLYGTPGTGKTYFAACIANKLIDQGYSALMTNFARLINEIQGLWEGKQEYINSLNNYSLLIFDDLGIERRSEYMQETVFNIIDSRYRSGLPFIVTTNLTGEEIKKTGNIGNQRIYDRILERCFPIEVSGSSRRRNELKESYETIKNQLGL